nr:HIRAN domain-containing protein [uncultured Blautia sp.]
MSKIYFTLTGTKYYHGKDFLEKGMKLFLVKEPDNEYDKDAIRVELPGIGKIGYVANSPYTVIGESISAGRMYDKMGKKAIGTVKFVTTNGVVCRFSNKKK